MDGTIHIINGKYEYTFPFIINIWIFVDDSVGLFYLHYI